MFQLLLPSDDINLVYERPQGIINSIMYCVTVYYLLKSKDNEINVHYSQMSCLFEITCIHSILNLVHIVHDCIKH